MLPFIEIPPIHIGPLPPITPFGPIAALGIYLGSLIIAREAKKDGLDPKPLEDFALWAVAAGVVCGHFVHLFFYHPEELHRYGPLQILRVWEGLSSFGGLLGGVGVAAVYFRNKPTSFRAYSDAVALGVAPGWGIARIGCILIHDHPGIHSDFFLAVLYPDGPRHDLGLDDFLLLMGITLVLHGLRRAGWLQGRLLPVMALLYGTVRFGLDFLRATDLAYVDARYFGFTPAQFACALLVAYGLWGLVARVEPRPAIGTGGRRAAT